MSIAIQYDNETEAEDVDIEISDNLRQLSQKAQNTFWRYIENIQSPNRLNETDFAQKMGYSGAHFSVLKSRACWIRAFQLIVTNSAIARTLTNTDKYIDNLENLAKEDVNANKALLNIANVLKRAGGLNININKSEPQKFDNPADMIDSMIISLARSGMSSSAILDRYIELKNQGAF